MPDTYGKYIRGGVNFSHDTAESVSYDNTNSGLTATDTQAAIDELASGAGGHVIVDDGDTELTQRAKLKFEGVYSSDNSTDEETNVAVVREMTEAQYALLTDDEKKGIILTENDRNPSLLTGDMIGYDNTTSRLVATDVQDAIDELASGGGSGGHTIINDSGTTLTQKDNLQFKGVYTQNNGDNTEVDICRTMTKAQMEALSGESLKGFINTSDEPDSLPLTAEWVAYDSNTSVKDKIDDIEVKKIEFTLSSSSTTSVSYPTGKDKSSIQILGFAFYRNYSWYFNNKATACVCSNNKIIVEVDNSYSYIQGLPAKILYI